MKIGTVIELNDFEQKMCEQLAMWRHANNRRAGVSNSKIGPQSDQETDTQGIGAEVAFARGVNRYPDLTVYTRSSSTGTDEGDVVLGNGMTVDVKATTYKSGRLVVVPWKKPTGDMFALMTGTFPNFTFRGVISQKEATTEEKLGTLGHGPTYIVEQSDLLEIDDAVRGLR